MSDTRYPDTVKYHKDHDWAIIDGDVATFGITWYAQDTLGDVVFVELPEVGFTTTVGEPYGEVESVKAVSDLIAPLDGEVVEINGDVADQPEKVNEDPYDAWLVRVRLADSSQTASLLDASEYRALVE